MKLSRARIRDFRSIRDTGWFDIGSATCLVGKNEAGKTAILEALYRLEPIVPERGKYDVTSDYPRADVEDYEQAIERKERTPAIVASAEYILDAADMAEAVDAFGEGLFKEPKLILEKGYSNVLLVTLSLDESTAIKTLLDGAGLDDVTRKKLALASTVGTLASHSRSLAATMNKDAEAAKAAAAALPDEQAKSDALLKANLLAEPQALKSLIADLLVFEKPSFHLYVYQNFIKSLVPKFLYFDDYFQMEGQANIQALKQREQTKTLADADRPLLGLLELARIDLDRLMAPKNTQDLVNKLEGASNHLSKQVLKYWSQNKHLHMKFDVRPGTPGDPAGMQDGMNIWATVFDSIHLVTTGVSTRSRGFRWFFSFLAYFSQQRQQGVSLILLLDEPGLFLHGKAQGDLLRYFEEELMPHHQVVYTTHSPFMVDPARFDRVRIVEDKSVETDEVLPVELQGTKVVSDVLEASEGSLFPLQHAFGYEIAQTLFVGPYSLIVEGVSDLIYLQTLSSLAAGRLGVALDPRWTITPVGGADKVPTFVALLGAQKGLTLATLIDIQRNDLQRIQNLYKSKLLKKKHVLTFGDFLGREDADIEDMFEVGFYLDLVNREYSKELQAPVSESDLQKGPRIVARLEAHFLEKPLKEGRVFNHYRPARLLAESGKDQSKIPDKTLERFVSAFDALNRLL